MTLGYWALLLPLVQLATAAWLVRRIYWRRYVTLVPALVIYAAIGTAWVFCPIPYWAMLNLWSRLCLVLLQGMIAAEVVRISCLNLHRTEKILSALVCVGTSATGCLAVRLKLGLELTQSLWIFRQYLLIFIASSLISLWLWRLRTPILENDEHYAYRTMFTLHAVRAAIGSVFVRGGFGDVAFGNMLSGSIWRQIDIVLWGASIVMWPLTAIWMTRGYSSRVPEWAAKEQRRLFLRKAAGA